jgi:hypothetical protein
LFIFEGNSWPNPGAAARQDIVSLVLIFAFGRMPAQILTVRDPERMKKPGLICSLAFSTFGFAV